MATSLTSQRDSPSGERSMDTYPYFGVVLGFLRLGYSYTKGQSPAVENSTVITERDGREAENDAPGCTTDQDCSFD